MLTPAANLGDPLATLKVRQRRAIGLGGSLVLASVVWACWPVATSPISVIAHPVKTQRRLDDTGPERLNLLAFGAPVWDPAPPPAKPAVAIVPPPPPPPPPLKLALLSITREPGSSESEPTYVATLYDETADKILILRSGDRVGLARVEKVTLDRVELADASGPRKLLLRQGQSSQPPVLRLLDPARRTR